MQHRDDESYEPDQYQTRIRTSAIMASEAVPNKIPNDCNVATQTVPNNVQNQCNMATEAVLNDIPNDCDIATELVPNEIEYDHRTYLIAYWMASQETAMITTKRWSHRYQSGEYHCWRTTHWDREDYQEPYRTKPPTKTLTKWRMKDHETITEQHTELNANAPYQRPTKWLPRSKLIFYQSCLQRWPHRSQPRTHQSYGRNDFHQEAVHQDPTECQIKRWRDLQMQCTKRLPKSQKCASITVSMTAYCNAYVFDMDQWYSTHARCN